MAKKRGKSQKAIRLKKYTSWRLCVVKATIAFSAAQQARLALTMGGGSDRHPSENSRRGLLDVANHQRRRAGGINNENKHVALLNPVEITHFYG